MGVTVPSSNHPIATVQQSQVFLKNTLIGGVATLNINRGHLSVLSWTPGAINRAVIARVTDHSDRLGWWPLCYHLFSVEGNEVEPWHPAVGRWLKFTRLHTRHWQLCGLGGLDEGRACDKGGRCEAESCMNMSRTIFCKCKTSSVQFLYLMFVINKHIL